jgi:hypothetical protein
MALAIDLHRSSPFAALSRSKPNNLRSDVRSSEILPFAVMHRRGSIERRLMADFVEKVG